MHARGRRRGTPRKLEAASAACSAGAASASGAAAGAAASDAASIVARFASKPQGAPSHKQAKAEWEGKTEEEEPPLPIIDSTTTLPGLLGDRNIGRFRV